MAFSTKSATVGALGGRWERQVTDGRYVRDLLTMQELEDITHKYDEAVVADLMAEQLELPTLASYTWIFTQEEAAVLNWLNPVGRLLFGQYYITNPPYTPRSLFEAYKDFMENHWEDYLASDIESAGVYYRRHVASS